MAHFLIEVGKLLLSKDLWNRVRDFVRFANRSPSWKNADTLRAKIKKRDRGLAKQFASSTRSRMEAFGFHEGNIHDFMAAFHELIDNGFSHGCISEDDSISLRVVIFDSGIIGEVRNENRHRKIPDLDALIERAPIGVMGRGLRRVCATADYYSITRDEQGIMFYLHKYAEYHNTTHQNIAIINLDGYSTDVDRKIGQSLVGKSGDVILVFSTNSASSVATRATFLVAMSDNIRRLAVVEPRGFIEEGAPPNVIGCFRTIKDAVAALRPDVPEVVKAYSDGSEVRKASRKRAPAKVT